MVRSTIRAREEIEEEQKKEDEQEEDEQEEEKEETRKDAEDGEDNNRRIWRFCSIIRTMTMHSYL